MYLNIIGSSSRGNSYLLSSGKSTIILECGVSISEIKKALNYDLSSVCCCLVTHEHQDHSKSIREIAAAGIDIYASKGTLNAIKLSGHRYCHVEPKKRFTSGEFQIMPFDVKHDCAEPFGFLISHPAGGCTIFCTDTYYIPYNFPGLNNIIVEVNYDEEILDTNNLPDVVKGRILRSHMEISTFKHFLSNTDLSQVHNIIMIHLSDGNSDEKRFIKEIKELTGKSVYVASPGMNINISKTPF